MRISPVDVVNKSFSKKMMGADADEVRIYLKMIATQMEEVLQENATIKEALREKESQIREFREREMDLRETLHAAAQVSDKMRVDAERECKLIIADAQQKAEMIIRDSRDSLKKTYQELTELKRARMQFEANLKAMAQAHLSLVEQGERFMPQMQLPTHNIIGSSERTQHSSVVSPLAAE